MSWRSFQDSTPNDNIDKIDKTPLSGSAEPHFVDIVDFVYRGEDQKKQETPAPFLAGHHVLVRLEPVGDIWFVSDEQAAISLRSEGLPVLLEKHAKWILQGEGHEERTRRLIEAAGRRHPMTQAVLEIFPGARITGVRPC